MALKQKVIIGLVIVLAITLAILVFLLILNQPEPVILTPGQDNTEINTITTIILGDQK